MMFNREIRCSVCGKTMWRKRGFSFKHKVDQPVGDGCYVTYNRRVHICNGCLATLKEMMQTYSKSEITLRIDGDAILWEAIKKEMSKQ